MTEPLYDIGARHGTDKAGQRQLLWIYDRFLAPYRLTPVSVLENGVVHGVDVDPATTAHAGERIGVFVGSQGDPRFLDHVVASAGPFDLVVDDGSHLARDQIGTLLHLWPHV